ncbi:uncharacterized protein LOC119465282 [Dermacentor silvarum]|uniref:uncharacterized protein LOC119465282 n=1 Tax=Dermacentor silvarum TaxID=543639 RepID=UPI0021011E05|nr:uncharacterized protein LOC119465282 [Dermacentor silvarum]
MCKHMSFPVLRWPVGPQGILLVLFFLPYATNGGKMSQAPGVVYPHLIESRSDEVSKVIRIAENITLHLKKSSLLGKEFLLRTYQGDVMEHNYLDGEILEENLYHDTQSFASVIVSDDDGLKVEGIISPHQGIKPLYSRERMRQRNVPHVVYALASERFQEDTEKFSRPVSSYVSQRHNVQQRLPRKVYLELLIIVDSYFRKQFDSKDALLTYLLISMNSVNMRYLTVSDPEVGIILRAVEVCNHQVENNFLVRLGRNHVDGYDTLLKLQNYVKTNMDKYKVYDAVYLITGLDMGYEWKGEWQSGQQAPPLSQR